MCSVKRYLAYILVMNGSHLLIDIGKLCMMRFKVASVCLCHICTFSRGFNVLGL